MGLNYNLSLCKDFKKVGKEKVQTNINIKVFYLIFLRYTKRIQCRSSYHSIICELYEAI